MRFPVRNAVSVTAAPEICFHSPGWARPAESRLGGLGPASHLPVPAPGDPHALSAPTGSGLGPTDREGAPHGALLSSLHSASCAPGVPVHPAAVRLQGTCAAFGSAAPRGLGRPTPWLWGMRRPRPRERALLLDVLMLPSHADSGVGPRGRGVGLRFPVCGMAFWGRNREAAGAAGPSSARPVCARFTSAWIRVSCVFRWVVICSFVTYFDALIFLDLASGVFKAPPDPLDAVSLFPATVLAGREVPFSDSGAELGPCRA